MRTILSYRHQRCSNVNFLCVLIRKFHHSMPFLSVPRSAAHGNESFHAMQPLPVHPISCCCNCSYPQEISSTQSVFALKSLATAVPLEAHQYRKSRPRLACAVTEIRCHLANERHRVPCFHWRGSVIGDIFLSSVCMLRSLFVHVLSFSCVQIVADTPSWCIVDAELIMIMYTTTGCVDG